MLALAIYNHGYIPTKKGVYLDERFLSCNMDRSAGIQDLLSGMIPGN
jgi:hypothetical protein